MPPRIRLYLCTYLAPSSDHSLLNLNVPLKSIIRRFEVFSDVWSENELFTKIDENSFKSTNTILWLYLFHPVLLSILLKLHVLWSCK